MLPIQGRTILITGGSGFLGRRLATALAAKNRVVLAARDDVRLRAAERATGCSSISLDVTRIESVRAVVTEVAPDTILHAAANKFVAVGEQDPFACIDSNVSGSQNIARVALERKVQAVVGISSDAAAPPAPNTYGLTKAIMERLFCSLGLRKSTRFTSVRLGNIAWSTGSVFPVWQQMNSESGLILSSGPNDTRFFITASEATQVVLTALEHVEELSGKVLARRMRAAQIRDLLDVWVRHRGGSWKAMNGAHKDSTDDRLFGDLELPYVREVQYDGDVHYVISFNDKVPKPLPAALSTANAERFSEREILELITPPGSDAA